MSIRIRSRDRQNSKRQKRSLHTFRNRSALGLLSLLLEFTISLDMHGNVLDCVPRVISKDIMLTYQTNATVLLHAFAYQRNTWVCTLRYYCVLRPSSDIYTIISDLQCNTYRLETEMNAENTLGMF